MKSNIYKIILFLVVVLTLIISILGTSILYKTKLREIVLILSNDIAYDISTYQYLSAEKKINFARSIGFNGLSLQYGINTPNKNKCLIISNFDLVIDGMKVGEINDCADYRVLIKFIFESFVLKFFVLIALGAIIIAVIFPLYKYKKLVLKLLHDAKVDPGLFLKEINADDKIYCEIQSVVQKIVFYEKESIELKNEIEKNQIYSTLAEQVSHDIRSPLAALNVVISNLGNISEDKRLIIRSSVQRINDISNNLLDKKFFLIQDHIKNNGNQSTELLSPIIDGIISEKRTQFRDRSQIEILAELNSAYGLFSNVDSIELKRLISNLINNSVESIPRGELGVIEVSIKSIDDQNCIMIRDNGKGIPPHILAKLGERGVTEGKEKSNSGSGLGIYHAKKTIEELGGTFLIESNTNNDINRGTKISIFLPKSETPGWFVQELVIDPDLSIVSLDDDISTHQIWAGRLKGLTQGKDKKLEHFIFNSGDEFFKAALNLLERTNYFLIDLELLGQDRSGLTLIEELKIIMPDILKKTILVTSRYEEPQVRERCADLGIKLIPKVMAGFVPMKFKESMQQVDAVLLDDDELVRMTWMLQAKSKKKNLKIYLNPDELLRDIDLFQTTTPFYVDSSLGIDIDGRAIKGEEVLEQLSKKGFTELYLCTGYDRDQFLHLKFIKDVFSKTPQI